MGGKLKFAEFTSGRFADVLSNLYLGYCVLWFARKEPCPDAQHVLDMAMQDILCDTEEAFHAVFENFPVPYLGPLMRVLTFPTGRTYSRPNDTTIAGAANAITTPTQLRALFQDGLYLSADPADRVALLHDTLAKAVAADKIYAECRKTKRTPTADEQVHPHYTHYADTVAPSYRRTPLCAFVSDPHPNKTKQNNLTHRRFWTMWRLRARLSSRWTLLPAWAMRFTRTRAGPPLTALLTRVPWPL